MNRILLLSIVFLSSVICCGQYRFIENKGQWHENVQFKTDIPGGSFYLEKGRFTFDRYDTETVSKVFAAHSGLKSIPIPEKLKCHAYHMTFMNSLSHQLKGKKAFETYYAYYLGNRSGKNARGFEEVIYENLYEGIDLKVHSKGNLKYDFIVDAGADPNQIEIKYEGVKPKLKSDGRIVLNTSLGKIEESEPFAYQVIDGLITRVYCEYELDGQSVKFKLGEYDLSQQLIIDPELIFSTYSGSFANNFGYTATFDSEGHLYSGSTVFGNGYPVTSGAYQTIFSGATDVGLSKFSLDGTSLIYSTLIGGSNDDVPHSLVTDSIGNLYVLGTTGSDNFPVTSEAVQNEFQGGTRFEPVGLGIAYTDGSDIFVSIIGELGQNLLASTYLGGSQNDGLNTAPNLVYNYADEIRGEIELDDDGQILIGSSTLSPDFPTTTGALNEEFSGSQDGIFTILEADLSSLVVSTFIGGNANDAVYAISYSEQFGTTLCGGTDTDTLFIGSTGYQPEFSSGSADGFILTLNNPGNTLLSSTYLGTEEYDQAYFVDRDSEGDVYVFGQTESTGSEFFFNANYGQAGTGMFVTKLSSDLSTGIFSTTFGNEQGVPSLSPVAFAVDICNRVYLSGWGGSTNNQGHTFGLDVTSDAFQSTTDSSDFYFMVLEDDANALTFATFYGGAESAEHVDGGTSRFDRAGKIYQAVCAGCQANSDFPIEPSNALSPLNNSSGCNLGVTKFDFDLALALADFQAEDECLPNSVFFDNTSDLFTGSEASFTWFVNGELLSTEDEFEFLFETGEYEIQLVLKDPQACNLTDQITKTVSVFPQLILQVPDTIILCEENTFTIEAVTNGTANLFTWAEDENLSDIIQQGPIDSVLTITVNEPTSVYLEVDNGLCTDLREVYLVPGVQVELSTDDDLLCNTDTFEVFLTTNYPEGLIEWAPEDLLLSGQGVDTVLFNTTSSLEIEVTVTNSFGCGNSSLASLSSFDINLIGVTEDTLACLNDPITLFAESSNALTYEWSNSLSFDPLLNEGGENFITVTPSSTQKYFIRVNNNGCILLDTVVVSLLEASTTLTGLQYICQGDTAQLFVLNDFPGNSLTHSWEPSELIVSGNGTFAIEAILEEPTTFSVTSSTEFGCAVENSLTVFTSPLGGEEIDALAEPQFLLRGESSQLGVLPMDEDYFYQWSPSTYLDNSNFVDAVSTPEESIWYTITILDADDLGFCQKTDSVLIQIFDSFCGRPNIFVPNAFTPNGDGENDEVLVRGRNITDLTFTIFDRWGEEVFKTQNQSEGWDGTYKGNPAEPAVFVFQLEAVCDDGETYFEKGNITLIR